VSRTLAWGTLHNARDLGGLPTATGETVSGRFFRTPRLDTLDAAGWSDLLAAGVRTIVDLRNADEIAPLEVPPGVERRNHPIEDQNHRQFMDKWGRLLNSPIYYADNLRYWPERIVAVFRSFADAPDGGIVFHCAAGRDRTGLVTALLLQLAGVDDEAIIDDYLLSVTAMNDYFAAQESPHEQPRSVADLDLWMTEVGARLREFLAQNDAESFLSAHGLSEGDIARVRARLTQ
jgi:protein tyrosine/serine phosphatase